MDFNSVILDPTIHNNFRTEFKIPNDKMILGTLRISNLSPIIEIGRQYEYTYDAYAGIFGLIKNIYIVNNGDVIDSLYEAQSFMAFKNQNNTNDKSNSSNQQLVANFLGFSYDLALNKQNPVGVTDRSYVSIDKFTTFNEVGGSNVYEQNTTLRYKIDDDLPTGNSTGYIDLTRCFNFLKSITFLDTSVFSQLRIIIEYNEIFSTSLQYGAMADSFEQVGTINKGFSRPILIYDEIVDDERINKIRKNYNQVVNYNTIELIKTPFVLNGRLSELNIKLTGFDGKYLNRLCIFKQEFTDFKRCYSFAYKNEIYNFIINGRKIYPYDINTKNKKLSYLTESWGNFAFIGFENDATRPNIISTERRINNNDYIGSIIQQRIDELILNYSVNDPNSATINLLIYGEVRKQIIIVNGKYIISYI